MASYKLNMARIRGCPPAKDVVAALSQFGLPEGEEFGVLNFSGTEQSAFATIVRRTEQAVQQVDEKAKELTAAKIERAAVIPIAVIPAQERLELYAGSAGGIEQVGIFFAGCLAFQSVTEGVELDVLGAVQKLAEEKKFQLRGIRIGDFCHNDYTKGPYAPKFLDTENGMEFLEKYLAGVTSATVRFAGPTGKVNVTVTPAACFTYSCNEDDQPAVQAILRKLV